MEDGEVDASAALAAAQTAAAADMWLAAQVNAHGEAPLEGLRLCLLRV